MSTGDGITLTAMTESDVARLVELSEARAYARLVTGAPRDLSDRYGLAVHRQGSAHAFVASRFCDSLILNRVIGLGTCEPVTDGTIKALETLYLASGVSTYAMEISPASEPTDLPARLRSWGFVPFKQTTMLYRRGEPIARPACDLRVMRAHPEHAAVFAELSCGIFQFAEPFPSLLRATFACPTWQHWLAFDGERPVSAAITYLEGEVAWIGWVGTLPEYRGRGAQSAIAAAQLQEACASGVRWLTLETATGTKNRPSQSLRNYVRLGWTPAYDRLVYVRKSERRT